MSSQNFGPFIAGTHPRMNLRSLVCLHPHRSHFRKGQNITVPVITIDGGAGVGKTTTETAVARKLGWWSLDSGVLYRATALLCWRHGVEMADIPSILKLIQTLDVKIAEGGMVYICGEEETANIRSSEIGSRASLVSKIPEVRQALLSFQFSKRQAPGLVANGRDMAYLFITLHRYFLVASVDVRVERARQSALHLDQKFDADATRQAIIDRDLADRTRSVAPLIRHPYAIEIDTSDSTVEQVANFIVSDYEANKGKVTTVD